MYDLSFKTVLVCCVALFSSGCASIVSHSRWPVSIHSSPNSASIRIVDRKGVEVYSGTTPANVDLRSGSGFFRRAMYMVTFDLPGYAQHTETIEYKLNGWYWGNLVFGGFIGFLIVDPATGAMYKVRNPQLRAILTEQTSSTSEPSLHILGIDEIPKDLLGDLEPLQR